MSDEYHQIMQEGGSIILPKVCYVIRNNVEKLLNGITTNELTKSRNALIDRFGKLIILFDQKMVDDTAYIIFEEQYEKQFLEHTAKYAKLTKSNIEKSDKKVIHVISKKEETEITFPQSIGYLTLVDSIENSFSKETYNIIRLENTISVQGIDFEHPMFLDLGLYDTISFTKGCYLGQEVMARVHNLSKPARKLVRILYDILPEQVTINKAPVGKITSSCFSPKYNKYLAFAVISRYEEEIDDGEMIE